MAELIPSPLDRLAHRHLLAGWLGLLIFLSLGIVLEALHGFKVAFYLDPPNSTRRLMWTLAHTHGTLFSLIQIAFALSLARVTGASARGLTWISRCLLGALGLLPLGFFLGGLRLHAGDPGVGIFLVPPGAALLLVGVAGFVRLLLAARRGGQQQGTAGTAADASPPVNPVGRAARKR